MKSTESAPSLPSLPYREPSVVVILTLSSLILLLNAINHGLDRILYCGLLGQVFLGVAWGTPGAKWLSAEAEGVMVQLGYLGLLLVVYQGGLSTSLKSLKANLFLSLGVATTGVCLPIAFSFALGRLVHATPLQCFAAGAALCSTSLGTAFTVLATSGLVQSRLGVVLTSAAMMDDVAGLIMVQIISNLGSSDKSISAVTVVRPLLVSLAFAVVVPFLCFWIVRPATCWLNTQREKQYGTRLNAILGARGTALALHTLVLVGCVAAASYAGTSNLFAAYIAGASISWWDSEVPHLTTDINFDVSGLEIYDKYYAAPVNRILRPFFFASIGFSIPITEMFSGWIVWRGIVYTLLMIAGKVVCGTWLLRLVYKPIISTRIKNRLPNRPKLLSRLLRGKSTEKSPLPTVPSSSSAPVADAPTTPTTATSRCIYPASILGCAMVARGEIGFLISSLAESNGVFASSSDEQSSSDMFLVVTWAIVLCTILGPLAVGLIVRRVKRMQRKADAEGGAAAGQDVLGIWGMF